MRAWNLGEVCEHGRLGRSCPICERDDEIDVLRAEVARLTDILINGVKWLEDEGRFDVVWTKEEIESAKDSAQNFASLFGLEKKPTRDELIAEVARLTADLAHVESERLELAQDIQHVHCKAGPLSGALADLRDVEVPSEIGAMLITASDVIERLTAERDVLREALHSETTQREFLRRDLCDIAKGSRVNYPDVEAAKAEIIRRASQCARAEEERDRYRAAIEKHRDNWRDNGSPYGSDHDLWAALGEVGP